MFFISSLQALSVWAKAKIYMAKQELNKKSLWLQPWQKALLQSKAEQMTRGSRNGNDQFGFQTRVTFFKETIAEKLPGYHLVATHAISVDR